MDFSPENAEPEDLDWKTVGRTHVAEIGPHKLKLWEVQHGYQYSLSLTGHRSAVLTDSLHVAKKKLVKAFAVHVADTMRACRSAFG